MAWKKGGGVRTATGMRDWRLLTGAIAALIAVAGVIGFQAIEIRQIQARIISARERYRAADKLLTLLSSAETGQRGYLLTGSEKYLTPYSSAIGQIPDALARFLAIDGSPASRGIETSVAQKLAELAKTIQLFRSGNRQGALEVVKTDYGNVMMMQLREQIGSTADRYYLQAGADRGRLARVDSILTLFSLIALSGIATVLVLYAIRIRRTLISNQKLTGELEERNEAYRMLVIRLESIREDERTLVARELHDELGQHLTGIKMEIAGAKTAGLNGNQERFVQKLATATEDADGAIRLMRQLATRLRPPQLDHLGLVDALEAYAEEFGARTGVEVETSLPHSKLPLSEAQNVALFRIVQESLTNVARHARAKKVEIGGVLEGGELRLTVADDGVGMETSDSPRRSLGMLGMRERAHAISGELDLHSAPGAGTRVTVRVRVAAAAAGAR